MERWRGENPNAGFDLGGGLNSLMDLRFADDILLFAKSASEAIALLDSLLVCFAHVGLQLNATKTVALTNEAQPQPTLRTGNGIVLDILDRDAGHQWLWRILSARGSAEQCKHVQQASKAFFANQWILRDKSVSVRARLHFFESVVTSVACSGAGYRTVHQQDY